MGTSNITASRNPTETKKKDAKYIKFPFIESVNNKIVKWFSKPDEDLKIAN